MRKKSDKQILFERMNKVAGMPLNENILNEEINPNDLNKILDGYIEAALWTEEERLEDELNNDTPSKYDDEYFDDTEDESDEEIKFLKILKDKHQSKTIESFSREDIEPNSLIKAYTDIKKFIQLAGEEAIDEAVSENGYEYLGHDIWLTRNRHGAGFFDRSYDNDNEKRLEDAAHNLGEVDLFINDNMKLSFSNENNENVLRENYNDVYDYYNLYDETFREILSQMLNKDTTKIVLKKIKPSMYQQALTEFVKYGELVRYPTKYIEKWKNIIIENFSYLDVITMFFGHTNYFDIDTFNDYVFNPDETGHEGVSSWDEAMEYLEKEGYNDILDAFLPQFSNGHDLISDYGLEPLRNIVDKLLQTEDPNEILVLINKALDISHQRSDLSELFIEGGQASLNKISGLDESVYKMLFEEINKFFKFNTL